MVSLRFFGILTMYINLSYQLNIEFYQLKNTKNNLSKRPISKISSIVIEPEVKIKKNLKFLQQKKPLQKKKLATNQISNYPMWKVLMIKNENYDKKLVVEKMHNIMTFLSIRKCENLYEKAQKLGIIELTTAPQEHAEFYVFELMNNYPIIFSKCTPIIDI